MQHPIFINSESIAAFYAYRGEIDPIFILEQALKLNKKCYLPIIDKQTPNTLIFCQIDKHTHYLPNSYGILEPELNSTSLCLPAAQLDLVLVPLLGIDKKGHRLGRGGGFYDMCFQESPSGKPFLMGLAYTFQYLEQIPTEPHDIKLDGLATEQDIILF